MRLYRRVSRKRYFGKAVYEYERFYVPVPKRFNDIVKPFLGKDLEVTVEKRDDGFLLYARVACRGRSYSIYDVLFGASRRV